MSSWYACGGLGGEKEPRETLGDWENPSNRSDHHNLPIPQLNHKVLIVFDDTRTLCFNWGYR